MRVQEDDSFAPCSYTSIKGMLIIHHIRDKQGFMAEVTFHAIYQAKNNRPFVRPTASNFLLDQPGPWRSLLTMMMRSLKEPTNEVGRLYETDLGDASTSEERCIPSQADSDDGRDSLT